LLHDPVLAVTGVSDRVGPTMLGAKFPQRNDPPERAMTPKDIIERRVDLGLTVDELAFALNVTEAELMAIEAGESRQHLTREFQEAFDAFEERVFGTYVGA
jgi:DNA-binding XRE family transcriptional regulator